MKIQIRPFAAVKDICGFEVKEVLVSSAVTARGVAERLVIEYPRLAELLDSLLYAVNEEYADGDRKLADNDVLALFPPVSGG